MSIRLTINRPSFSKPLLYEKWSWAGFKFYAIRLWNISLEWVF